MEIKNKYQLNQGVDQYKLLSTASGVGALVATKMGFFVMPLTIDEWDCIKRVQNHVKNYPDDDTKRVIKDEAVSILDDTRFVNYLREKEKFEQLRYLISIPQLQLDRFNNLKNEDQPLYKQYIKPLNKKPQEYRDYFNVPGIIFPRWLFNPLTHELRTYEEWKKKWKDSGRQPFEFAPPKEFHDDNGVRKEERLRQMHLVLICENGHISDIPWNCFFASYLKDKQAVYKSGYDLFKQNANTCNGRQHKLIYLENENHSDGWGRLRCLGCGEEVPLDGIMNLKPGCSKEMPWLGLSNGNISIDSSKCLIKNNTSTMRVALVTSHSTYFADTISSLYIPQQQDQTKDGAESPCPELIQECVDWLNNLYNESGDSDKQSFVESYGGKGSLYDLAKIDFVANGKQIQESDFFSSFDLFMQAKTTGLDKREEYRYEEYEAFTSPNPIKSLKLSIKNVDVPKSLEKYFSLIRQVHTLCLTKTQLGFFRGKYNPPYKSGNKIEYPQSMKLSGFEKKDLYVYPALQEYGEGIFLEFNKDTLTEWSKIIGIEAGSRYSRKDFDYHANLSLQLDNSNNPDWFYLLHTFAHVLIKELEFSCGYPSDSLSERIYYSNRMCGVLIYTVDGAEGGMGGLVCQGRKDLIEKIVTKAIRRSNVCSSDPICWQHTEDSMNYAACFSCAMISETSCEYGNNGLDRRALVDGKFGFFKDLL